MGKGVIQKPPICPEKEFCEKTEELSMENKIWLVGVNENVYESNS